MKHTISANKKCYFYTLIFFSASLRLVFISITEIKPIYDRKTCSGLLTTIKHIMIYFTIGYLEHTGLFGKLTPSLVSCFFFLKKFIFFSTHTPSCPQMRTIIQVGCRVPQLLFIWVHLLNLKTTWCCTWGLLLQRPTLIYSSFLTFNPPKLYTAERKTRLTFHTQNNHLFFFE